MKKPNITQREARRLRATAQRLETVLQEQRRSWVKEWPDNGVLVATLDLANQPGSLASIRTARKLRHAVVVTVDGNNVHFHALPLPEVTP